MEKKESLSLKRRDNHKRRAPACFKIAARCLPLSSSYERDSESDSEGEDVISQEHRPKDYSVGSPQELKPGANQPKAEIVRVRVPNNVNLELEETPDPIETVTQIDREKNLGRKLSMSAQRVFNESITEIGSNLDIKKNYTDFLTRRTSDLFNLTGSLEEETKRLASQFLGFQDEESKSEEVSDDNKSAELTPRSEVYSQEPAGGNKENLTSEIQAPTVTSPPNGQVLQPKAQRLRSVALEDPNFPNDLKARAFDYINKAAGLDYSISPSEKPNYFDYAMKMIDQKSNEIKKNYNDPSAGVVLCWTPIAENKIINDKEKIKLFDLINAKVDLPVEDDNDKIKKFIFIVKAIKLKKSAIIKGLNRLDAESKSSQREISGR
jgi:hypothetical protein